MERRSFLRLGAAGIAAAPFVLPGTAVSGKPLGSSPIAIAYHGQASSLSLSDSTYFKNHEVTSFTLSNSIVAMMVDHVVTILTGIKDTGKAWESLFPAGSLTAQTKVGIKINNTVGWDRGGINDWLTKMCPFCSKAAVADAIVSGLAQMLNGTFPRENVTVFDLVSTVSGGQVSMVMQGYRLFTGTPYDDKVAGQYRIRLIERTSPTEVPSTSPAFNAGPSTNSVRELVLPTVYENDYWINVIIPKDHYFAGVSDTLKASYGCVSACNLTHGDNQNIAQGRPGVQYCIPDCFKNVIAQTPCILHLMDGLAGLYDGGPIFGSVFQKNTVAATRDPLALSHYELEIINAARRSNGLHDIIATTSPIVNGDPNLSATGSAQHPNAIHLALAQQPPYSFGTFSSDVRLYDDLTAVAPPSSLPSLEKAQSRLLDIHKTAGGWRLDVLLDNSGRLRRIDSRILDLRGRPVAGLKGSATRRNVCTLEWDGHADHGSRVSAGVYTWTASVDGVAHSATLHIQ